MDGPKRPARGGGSCGMDAGAVDGELTAEAGRRRGFGLHCAQAGRSGFGASGMGAGAAAAEIALGCVLACFISRRLLTTRQAGFAAGMTCGSGAGASGGGSIAGGFHSGWNSPFSLNLVLTAISSAISYSSCLRWSRSFPISDSRYRTSCAIPLVKSLTVLRGPKLFIGG